MHDRHGDGSFTGQVKSLWHRDTTVRHNRLQPSPAYHPARSYVAINPIVRAYRSATHLLKKCAE
jgi:hypothetical protein